MGVILSLMAFPESSFPLGDTAALLKGWALEEGFDRAGVASLEPAEHGAAFLRWLERGDQAGMGYLGRRVEARLEPATIFPGARSALCVALQYAPLQDEQGETIPEPGGDLWPRVARYARGRDYHDVMERRLKRLASRIAAAFPGVVTRPYVDTGPVLERDLAARAGLGVVGKNTNLLHRRAGSWFLLGEIFLTLDLSPDAPLTDLCGRCTLCLQACPTGALPEPYRLDANRCISYWTIEHRGAFPPAVREGIGDWVFGCDICQEVCPWNRKSGAPGAHHPELELPPRRAGLDLVGLLLLRREEFIERFQVSPMKRPKLEGLQRNAAVAMGNRGEPRYVAPLALALAEGEALVRAHAAWALGRIGGEEARRALAEALENEADEEVRAEIRQALAPVFAAPDSPERTMCATAGEGRN
ncbi:MAG TPA: tRNA epoxyqueuosine(34) reductase QueG [Thermoanaerobaculia bacterium]|nr:tRNA epoxyqueuosine(34) reductase QueG [Thermoanaerobaculia bacterium]